MKGGFIFWKSISEYFLEMHTFFFVIDNLSTEKIYLNKLVMISKKGSNP